MGERITVTSVNDRVDLIGILLGLFDNGTGLTHDEVYSRIGELQQLEDWDEEYDGR